MNRVEPYRRGRKVTFVAWLRRQVERDDHVGSFARSCRADPYLHFRGVRAENQVAYLRKHLRWMSATASTFKVFDGVVEAWRRLEGRVS